MRIDTLRPRAKGFCDDGECGLWMMYALNAFGSQNLLLFKPTNGMNQRMDCGVEASAENKYELNIHTRVNEEKFIIESNCTCYTAHIWPLLLHTYVARSRIYCSIEMLRHWLWTVQPARSVLQSKLILVNGMGSVSVVHCLPLNLFSVHVIMLHIRTSPALRWNPIRCQDVVCSVLTGQSSHFNYNLSNTLSHYTLFGTNTTYSVVNAHCLRWRRRRRRRRRRPLFFHPTILRGKKTWCEKCHRSDCNALSTVQESASTTYQHPTGYSTQSPSAECKVCTGTQPFI